METLSHCVLTFLLNALWQAALLTLVGAAATRVLRRAPARYRHALWVAALGLSVLLPICSFTNSAKFAALAAQAAAPLQVESLPLPLGADSAQSLVSSLPVSTGAQPSFVHKLLNTYQHRTRLVAFPSLVARAVLGFYLLFLFLHLSRLARAWRRTQSIRRSSGTRPFRPESRVLLVQCQAALGLRRVAVCSSSDLAGPVTIGVFRPVIILPTALFDGPPSDEFASALCHEMAHVRRSDYLLNLVCEFALAALAFHPAAWLLKRRIDETRELACDEAASECFVGPAAYARSLVSLANSIAPVALNTRPGCTLGVFDANILEERIMQLLSQQAKVSSRRARLHFAGAALALAACALTANAFSVQATKPLPSGESPNFSGRWELDKSQSDLPSPAPEDLLQVIEQSGTHLKITTRSTDWNDSRPIAVTLFALMIPELDVSTDNREVVQPYGRGQLRSKSHFEDGALVTDWTLERDGRPETTGRWVRRLSDDSRTLTVDISGHDPARNLDGHARVVFVKRGGTASAYLGTWHAEFHGRRFLTLTLRQEGQRLAGSLTPFSVSFDSVGNLSQAEAYPAGGWEVLAAWRTDGATGPDAAIRSDLGWRVVAAGSSASALHLKCKDADTGEVNDFVMRLVDEKNAEFSFADAPPLDGKVLPKPIVLVRDQDQPQDQIAPGGPVAGVSGGVQGGVAGGVTGLTSSKEGEPAATVSGTVFDPSGGRVPNAVVMILSKANGAKESTVTNDSGEFSFTNLAPGEWDLSVAKPGFKASQMTVDSKEKNATSLKIVLDPGIIQQEVIVKGARVKGETPAAATAAPATAAPERIHMGGSIEAAKLIAATHPEYPESARAKGIQGEVLMEAVISKDGIPVSLKVISSPDDALAKAALEAVKTWRYKPTLLNGKPIEVVTTITVNYELQD